MKLIRRVIKLGGSLLEPGDPWAPRLTEWIARQPPAENLLVVGGGKLADAVRSVDRVKPLDESQAHWLCVRAMAIHSERVARRLGSASLLSNVGALRAGAAQQRLVVIDPWRFMRFEEPRFVAESLPASWEVSSDSIAARLAEIVSAAELVLMKSVLPPASGPLADLASIRYVDSWFPRAALRQQRIRCVNLRDDAFPETEIRP